MPISRLLPTPTNEAWAWQIQATCRGMSSSHFFHPWGEQGTLRQERIQRAKQVCAECPVIAACQQHALAVPELYGIWGGLSEDERLILLNRPVRRSHPRPRPQGSAMGSADMMIKN
ncbi:MAG TPA: WhiB family transcriptional regulator [Mycobacterium sp.]